MDFSKMKEKLQVYTLGTIDNNSGGQSGTWTLSRTVWASIKQLSSSKQLSYNQTFEMVGYELMVRYNPSFEYTLSMKYKHDNKELIATSIDNVTFDDDFVLIQAHYKVV